MDYIQRYLIEELAEDYHDGLLTDSEFLRRLTLFTGNSDEALVLAGSLGYEQGKQVAGAAVMERPRGQQASSTDRGITVRNNVTLLGYLARPSADGAYPAVLVIHENRGLWPPHYQDVARRLAKEGYVALAIDLISREGGTARYTDQAEVKAVQARIPRELFVKDMNSGVEYLKGLPYVRQDRIGAIGFCFGGGMVWLLTVSNPDVTAAPGRGSSNSSSSTRGLRQQ